MDKQTRKDLRCAYDSLRTMDADGYPASLDAAVRFYGVGRAALARYPTDQLVVSREREMNAMLDRITKRLTGVRSSIF